jgi:cystathionine beta-lyase/cystathionine gamma-synthase
MLDTKNQSCMLSALASRVLGCLKRSQAATELNNSHGAETSPGMGNDVGSRERGCAKNAAMLLQSMPTLEALDAVNGVHSMGSHINNASFASSPESICLRRAVPTEDGQPLVPGIAQSTTFQRSGVGSDPTHQYSRVSNPSVTALEETLGQLEKAPPAVCFGTGLAAETALFLSLLRNGDHVICGRGVYGGTTRLLQQLLSDLGIETTFVDSSDLETIRQAIRPNTELIFVETPANPTLDITDIAGCAAIAKQAGVRLAVDNTFLTPILQQPLDLGADISIYSTTKFIDGHSVALGGSIVSRDEELLERVRFIRKCTGAIQSPFNGWLTSNGIKTLPLRINAQSRSAEQIATWLEDNTSIDCVCHPSLAVGHDASIIKRQHLGGHGAVVSFEVSGGYERACAFVQELKLCTLVEHVGSVETLITHPASMTHADVPREQRLAVGISDGLLRLSVGLEDVSELIADIEQALEVTKCCIKISTLEVAHA